MAWSSPAIVVAGQPLTAALWNAQVRDNLLESEMAKAGAVSQIIMGTGNHTVAGRSVVFNRVAASESTTATADADLTTPGPVVTMTTGIGAIVLATATMANNTIGGYCNVSYLISGATTANAGNILNFRAYLPNDQIRVMGMDYYYGLNAGSNSFKLAYGNNGTGTATFAGRHIVVWPIG